MHIQLHKFRKWSSALTSSIIQVYLKAFIKIVHYVIRKQERNLSWKQFTKHIYIFNITLSAVLLSIHTKLLRSSKVVVAA
jgi:hypothetical protein